MRTILGVIVLCCGLSASALDIGPPIPMPEAPAVQAASPCPCGPGCDCGPDCPCRQAKAKAGARRVQVAVFGAEWCGPCRKLHPECEGLAGVGFVDIDKEPEKARSLWTGADAELTENGLPNVLPALVVIIDGKPAKWLTPKPNKIVRRSDVEWYLSNS